MVQTGRRLTDAAFVRLRLMIKNGYRTVRWAVLLSLLVAVGLMQALTPVGAAQAAKALEAIVLETSSGPRTIMVEIARTDREKALGLMYRTHLDDNKGMLFVYEYAQEITMWMKNTYIPLDMVFLRSDGSVLRIAEQTEPLSEEIIASQGPARFVLELAGGAARRMGLKPGDRLRHPMITR